MKTQCMWAAVLPFVVAIGAIAVTAAPSMAQEIRDCPGSKGECVEFIVRYHASRRVELLDVKTRKRITPECKLADGCKTDAATQLDSSTIVLELFRTNPHYCYYTYSGGYSYKKCPAH